MSQTHKAILRVDEGYDTVFATMGIRHTQQASHTHALKTKLTLLKGLCQHLYFIPPNPLLKSNTIFRIPPIFEIRSHHVALELASETKAHLAMSYLPKLY